ncbi:MAG: amidohydrolase [Acidobacteria bacterium]|nr:MAG: amidohydrolase [Acidobacteriota bacterium]REK07399.1 MAG: amidohydrolase [Acidobacteriota bacterium]
MACAASVVTWSASARPAAATSELPAGLAEEIAADYEGELEALFVHFHRNPELSFREFETAKRLAAELRASGVEVTEGVGGTGIVGVLRNGEGPTVLVRADMDGLPVEEDSGLEYASTARQVDITGEEVPVMHACGHDVHITAMVGTARRLAAHRDRWRGTVLFVGQPAEERISGARAMLEDGLYERFPVPDHALAFHVSAGAPAGRIHVPHDLVASSSDSVDITVFGVGAHGASPHRGKDPIYVASQIVVALQSIVSRELNPLEPGVVTVGAFHGGFKHNIIPDRVELQLTVRSNAEQTREQLLSAIERIARGTALAAGLPEDRLPRVELTSESTPPTRNDPELARRVERAIVAGMGEEILYVDEPSGMGAEDFAYFVSTEHDVPGVYFSVGGTPQEEIDAEKRGGPPVPSHHSPFFKVAPEPSIRSATMAMTLAVLELLAP